MTRIVSAVYGVAPGGVWSEESIRAVRDAAAENGLAFEVVESVPVPEDIKLGEESLWRNLHTFLEAVIPAAHEAGIRMGIHPDDPPWSMFGLPRIITNAGNLRWMFAMADDEANGLTLCTGPLGADPDNDLVGMAAEFADRIPFAHLRNIRRTGKRQFEKVGHPTLCGSIDIYSVARALVTHGFDGYVRPNHGRMIWGADGRCGYGLFDRDGATYLAGLFEALEKELRNNEKNDRNHRRRRQQPALHHGA